MIGLEIHCQLTSLNSKLFCPCKADYRGMEPNSNICPVCAGLPGSLPRLNRRAVEKAAMVAMALNCNVPKRVAFFRKNYFYPDLPKNFQITQLDAYGPTSIGGAGRVTISGGKDVRIRRVQLEEDPGRLVYEGASEKTRTTLVDYNRAGTPLVEIVTEPDFDGPRQVREFLGMLSDMLENLGVSDSTLEGAMRADGNVSVRDGPKVEIKNIGSFHDLEKAVRFEIARQESLTERRIKIISETRHWDDGRKVTVSARSKEDDPDYRYFLEADIPWVAVDSETIKDLKSSMPESVSSKRDRYVSVLSIPPQVADVLSADRFYSDLFEDAHDNANAREVANIITTDLMGLTDTREKREASRLTAQHLRDVAEFILSGKITRASARTALQEMVNTGMQLSQIIAEQGLENLAGESDLLPVIEAVISENSDVVEQARTNPGAINYLVGMVMKKTAGRADPKTTLDLIKDKAGLD